MAKDNASINSIIIEVRKIASTLLDITKSTKNWAIALDKVYKTSARIRDLQEGTIKHYQKAAAISDKEAKDLREKEAQLRKELQIEKEILKEKKKQKDLEDEVNKGSKKNNKKKGVFSNFGSTIKNVVKFGLAFKLVNAVFRTFEAGVRQLITTQVQFSQSMADLRAVTGSTYDEIELNRQKIVELGAASRYATTEIADLEVQVAKFGFSLAEINSITEGAVILAGATGQGLQESGKLVSKIIKQFSLDTREAIDITNVLTAAVTRSAANMSDLSASLEYVGSTAYQAGLSMEDTVALLITMADKGLSGSKAGTGLRRVITEIEKGIDDGIFTKDFTKRLNETEYLFDKIRLIATETKVEFDALGNVVSADNILNIQRANEIFGQRGQESILAILNTTEDLDDKLNQIKATMNEGLGEDVAKTRLEGYSGAIEQVSASWNALLSGIRERQGLIAAIERVAVFLNQQSDSEITEKAAEVREMELNLEAILRKQEEGRFFRVDYGEEFIKQQEQRIAIAKRELELLKAQKKEEEDLANDKARYAELDMKALMELEEATHKYNLKNNTTYARTGLTGLSPFQYFRTLEDEYGKETDTREKSLYDSEFDKKIGRIRSRGIKYYADVNQLLVLQKRKYDEIYIAQKGIIDRAKDRIKEESKYLKKEMTGLQQHAKILQDEDASIFGGNANVDFVKEVRAQLHKIHQEQKDNIADRYNEEYKLLDLESDKLQAELLRYGKEEDYVKAVGDAKIRYEKILQKERENTATYGDELNKDLNAFSRKKAQLKELAGTLDENDKVNQKKINKELAYYDKRIAETKAKKEEMRAEKRQTEELLALEKKRLELEQKRAKLGQDEEQELRAISDELVKINSELERRARNIDSQLAEAGFKASDQYTQTNGLNDKDHRRFLTNPLKINDNKKLIEDEAKALRDAYKKAFDDRKAGNITEEEYIQAGLDYSKGMDELDSNYQDLLGQEDFWRDKLFEAGGQALELTQQFFDARYEMTLQAIENEEKAETGRLEARYEKQSKLFQKQLDNDLVSREQYDAKMEELERQKKEKENEIARKTFEATKKADRAKALTDLPIAVADIWLNSLSAYDPVTASILAGAATAVAAAQTGIKVAAINKREFVPIHFKSGGLLSGPGHSDGGMQVGNTNMEVEGGEFVVNRASTARNMGLLHKINQNPTVSFKQGGLLATPAATGAGFSDRTDKLLRDISNKLDKPARAIVSKSDIKKNEERERVYIAASRM